MSLSKAKIGCQCVVTEIAIKDFKVKTRVMELGVVKNCNIMVVKKSFMKKTLLVVFNYACFTIKSSMADEIMVDYA